MTYPPGMLGYLHVILAGRIRNERGASAVEYGLLVAGVALLLVAVIPALGWTLSTVFAEETSKITDCPGYSAP